MENQEPIIKYNRAKSKVEKLKSFYTHLSIYLVVNTGITLLKVWGSFGSWDEFTDEFLTFDILSSWVVWGLLLSIHAFAVFILPNLLGYDWEERKIEKFMEEELKSKK